MSVSDFISLLGGVALFLFGMSIMGDALKKVAGNQLELVLYNLTSTPIKGVLLGTGVTAVIQSSSATSVMVVGFVNSGMMKVNQAIGIVLGAILGTSVTGWVLCLSNLSGGGWVALLSTSTLTALMATIGTLLRMISRKQTTRHVGEILLGFAVLMCVSVLLVTWLLALMMGYNAGEAAGLLAGSQTISAVIGVAEDTMANMGLDEAQRQSYVNIIPVSYAVTYIFGTAGSAWVLSSIGPKMLGGLEKVKAACKELEAKMGSSLADEPGFMPAARPSLSVPTGSKTNGSRMESG